jgi:hypothetical protein
MGLLNAMITLAEEWDDVQASLEPAQASRLRDLVAQFANETDTRASAKTAERIMDLLVEWLPVTHSVLVALRDPESRSWSGTRQATDRPWVRLAESLRARLGPPGTTFGDDDDGPTGASFDDDNDA